MRKNFYHYLQLVLNEGWKLTRHVYRSWYNPEKNEWIDIVQPGVSHASMVFNNPELFGIDPSELENGSAKDRDTVTFSAAFSRGWIRIAGEKRCDPTAGMIIEGNSLKALLRVMRMMYQDQDGQLQRCAIKVRTGMGGEDYYFGSPEAILGAARGKLPAPTVLDVHDSLVV